MAGLLDIDFNDPSTAGLLGMAQGFFDAGAPSRTRIGTGQAIMAGLQGMQQGQQGAQQYAINQELLRRKKAADDLNMEMNQFEFGQKKQTVADQKLARDAMIKYAKLRQAGIGQPQMQAPSSVQGYSMPSEQTQNNRVNGSYSPPMYQPQQQSIPQTQTMQRGKGSAIQAQIDDLNNQANFLDAEGVPSDSLRQKAIEMTKLLPKVKEWKEIRSGDQILYAPYFEDGSAGDAVPYEIAAKLHFGDNGQQLLGMDAYTGKVRSTNQKQQSLESLASDATARRGQNMVDARSRDQINQPTWNNEVGAFISPPTKNNPQGIKIDLAGFTKPEKPLTEVQAKAVTFASRMNNANNIINELSSLGTDKSSAGKQFMEAIPGIGGGLGNLYNATLPENIQKLDQAKRDWVNANLRNESGAVIDKDEFTNADKQYFPQIGDKPEVIKQKAINRKLAEEGMRSQSGSGAKNIDSIVSNNSQKSTQGMPKTKIVNIEGGGSASATLGADGNYYVQRNGKKYRVEE